MKWNLTKDLLPPRGQNIVVGWYGKPMNVRAFEGALIDYDPLDFWIHPPDYWAPIEALNQPEAAKIIEGKFS